METNNTNLDTEQLAHFCKAPADQLRMLVLRVLQHNSFSVQELCQILDIKQSAMSHHLKVLAEAGLVATRREGNTIFYRRHPFAHNHPLSAMQDALFACTDICDLPQQVAANLADIENSRTASSKSFFINNADKFREQQDLIASFEQYADSVEEILHSVPLPARELAIEIGPGEGKFLKSLSQYFDQVMAFDNSPAMLEKARETVTALQLGNTELHLGDTETARNQQKKADCIVINMVLHHVSSPARIFEDVATLIRAGGALIVTDLCHHDQQWASEACGDVWLGFEPEDLDLWAQKVGLSAGQSAYLAQRNGFRIQIRHFYKTEENTHE